MRIGVSGIRGIVGTEFGPSDVSAICDSFATLYGGSRCWLGMDTRTSGPMLKDAAAASIVQNGIEVHDLGVIPTPVIFHESRSGDVGIMITASHNPLEWNGLKFVINGRGIDPSTISKNTRSRKAYHGNIRLQRAATSSYVDEAAKLLGKVNCDTRVAIDAGSGAATDTARNLLEKMNCKVEIVESSRGPDLTSDSLDELAKASRKCDLGLGFDLDADRVVLARNGKIQSPDATVAIGITWAQENGCKSFATSQDTSVAIEQMIKKNKGSLIRTAVGELNVVNAIDKHKCDAGGEGSSAGFIFPKFNYCRDGILTGGIAAIMTASSQLDDTLEQLSSYYQIRQKIDAPVDMHNMLVTKVTKSMGSEFTKVSNLGGFYGVTDDSTWILVRGSNTENSVRVSAESVDPERAKSLVRQALEIVSENADR